MFLTWEKGLALCNECGETFEAINILWFGSLHPPTNHKAMLCCQTCLADLRDLILQECRDTSPVSES